jgi:hypothetical protein
MKKPITVALMSALTMPSCKYGAQVPEKTSVAYEMAAITVISPHMAPANALEKRFGSFWFSGFEAIRRISRDEDSIMQGEGFPNGVYDYSTMMRGMP